MPQKPLSEEMVRLIYQLLSEEKKNAEKSRELDAREEQSEANPQLEIPCEGSHP